MVAALGLTAIPSNARTLSSYSQKPIFSVVGDSISSHDYYEDSTYYGTGKFFDLDKNNMWWSLYSSSSNVEMGWSASVGMAQVSLQDSNFLSFFYPSRLEHLDNNGFPDYIAVYGGINDAGNLKNVSLFNSRYNQLVDKLHSMFLGVKLILMVPNYLPSSWDVASSKNALIDSYASYISYVATKNEDYYVDLRGAIEAKDTVEGVHPIGSGMQKIADKIVTALSNAREKEYGIDSIKADLDYDHYIIKVDAYNPDYDAIRFKFKLIDKNNPEQPIYNTDWTKDNCFYLDEINQNNTYEVYAEIDKDGDGIVDDSLTKEFSDLVLKRTGGTVYNGVDYSAVYDFNYYIEHNPDLYNVFRNNPYSALEHFVNYGMSEGRQAKSDFDVVSYRNRYYDLRQAFGWKNLKAYYDHYRTTGKREGRIATGCPTLQNGVHEFLGLDFSPVYDYNYYITHNPDVYNAFDGDENQVFAHFLSAGVNEGRRASEDFDVYSYRNQWADLRQAFGWNNLAEYYVHYAKCGKREGRKATGCTTLQNAAHVFFGYDFSPVYDYNYYVNHNPDVYITFNGDENQVFGHFLTAGMSEGRRGTEGFDVYSYRNQWSDLRMAYGWNNIREYYLHYVSAGAREGRAATGCDTLQNPIHTCFSQDLSSVYDYYYYINKYPDVKAAFNGDDLATFIHFATVGTSEGRQGSEGFNVEVYANNNPDLFMAFGFDLPRYYIHYAACGKNEGRIAV